MLSSYHKIYPTVLFWFIRHTYVREEKRSLLLHHMCLRLQKSNSINPHLIFIYSSDVLRSIPMLLLFKISYIQKMDKAQISLFGLFSAGFITLIDTVLGVLNYIQKKSIGHRAHGGYLTGRKPNRNLGRESAGKHLYQP